MNYEKAKILAGWEERWYRFAFETFSLVWILKANIVYVLVLSSYSCEERWRRRTTLSFESNVNRRGGPMTTSSLASNMFYL